MQSSTYVLLGIFPMLCYNKRHYYVENEGKLCKTKNVIHFPVL